MNSDITNYLKKYNEAVSRICLDSIKMVRFLIKNHTKNIFVIGNGGSASTASHFVCDLQKRGYSAISLVDNIALITAIGNDSGYEHVFSDQLARLAKPGDMLIAISGSGNSANILRAVGYARENKILTIAFTGFKGGALGKLAEINLNVPCDDMGMIETAHMFLVHLLAKVLEEYTDEL